jgi:hypothetical protein
MATAGALQHAFSTRGVISSSTIGAISNRRRTEQQGDAAPAFAAQPSGDAGSNPPPASTAPAPTVKPKPVAKHTAKPTRTVRHMHKPVRKHIARHKLPIIKLTRHFKPTTPRRHPIISHVAKPAKTNKGPNSHA